MNIDQALTSSETVATRASSSRSTATATAEPERKYTTMAVTAWTTRAAELATEMTNQRLLTEYARIIREHTHAFEAGEPLAELAEEARILALELERRLAANTPPF